MVSICEYFDWQCKMYYANLAEQMSYKVVIELFKNSLMKIIIYITHEEICNKPNEI